jgi:beta-phosphoglucomutase-like phosphatase (HAD superfamily)
MKLKALIWDVDGTLAETERDGHLPAVNEASAAVGQPLNWSWQVFQKHLHIPGNANRFRLELESRGLPAPQIEQLVADFAQCKKQLYIDKYIRLIPLRAGVRPMVEAAHQAGVRQAIVSTTYEAQIHALLDYQMADLKHLFWPILGKESGTKTAPDSPLYRQCQQLLAIPLDSILVIEDSENGYQAAWRAGLPCAIFYTDHSMGDDFRGARLVARSLQPFSLQQLETLCL